MSDINLIEINNFLSDEDCEKVIDTARNILFPSVVTMEITDVVSNHKDRICQLAWPKKQEYEVLQRISVKLSELTNLPIENQEPLQVIHYDVGGEYKSHFDAFCKESENIIKYGNRITSVIIYLNDVEEGGQTNFPKLDITINPTKGKCLIFNNLQDGDRHPLSLHCGLPVTKGEKWIATTWIRERAYI